MHTQAQYALIKPGGEITALRELFTELLADRRNVQHIADMMAGADIHYDMGTGDPHPLVGRWAPDLLLDAPTGPVRLARLTEAARPLLLDLTEDGSPAKEAAAWHDRVDTLTTRCLDPRPPATALLLRPDGYVAWGLGHSPPHLPRARHPAGRPHPMVRHDRVRLGPAAAWWHPDAQPRALNAATRVGRTAAARPAAIRLKRAPTLSAARTNRTNAIR